MASDKSFGVATQTSGFSRGGIKDSGEKQRSGTVADLDLPTYDDAERQGSEVANLIGMRDDTHRKLKARHIQLIGFVFHPFPCRPGVCAMIVSRAYAI